MDPEKLHEILEYLLEHTHKLATLAQMSDSDNAIMYIRRLEKEIGK